MSTVQYSEDFLDVMCSQFNERGIMDVELSTVHCSMWQLKLKMAFSCGDRLIGAFSEVYSVVRNAEVSMVASTST